MQNQDIRFVIRNLGLTAIKEDTSFMTIESKSNLTFLNLGKMNNRDNLTLSAIR